MLKTVIYRLYISIHGRVSRKFYWIFGILPFTVLGAVLGALYAIYPVSPVVLILFVVLCYWPTLAMQIKRWHDLDRSGWYCLLSLIPIVVFLVWIIIGLIPGTKGENRFGPDPLPTIT